MLYELVLYVSAATILLVIVYGLISSSIESKNGVLDIGASLVNVEFPLPYFAKPVSYLSIASITFFYSGLRLWKNKIAMWSHLRLSAIQLFSLVVAFASAYEVLYNFMLWGAIFSAQVLAGQLNPDVIASPSVVSPVPWNLVFATKMFSALFVISGYAVYFLRRIHRVNGQPEEI